MNTVPLVVEKEHQIMDKPGAQLAFLREKKGLTPEYVAGKLHLRTQLIGLLESDNYAQLPQAVFVKGYIRAYANFLGVAPEPLIESFNQVFIDDQKMERTLWQSRRTPNSHERIVRWVTGLIVVTAVISLTVWWQQSNNLIQTVSSQLKATTKLVTAETITESRLPEPNMAQVAKIQSLFKPIQSTTPVSESTGG